MSVILALFEKYDSQCTQTSQNTVSYCIYFLFNYIFIIKYLFICEKYFVI